MGRVNFSFLSIPLIRDWNIVARSGCAIVAVVVTGAGAGTISGTISATAGLMGADGDGFVPFALAGTGMGFSAGAGAGSMTGAVAAGFGTDAVADGAAWRDE